jgi:hypothetical protein
MSFHERVLFFNAFLRQGSLHLASFSFSPSASLRSLAESFFLDEGRFAESFS